MKIVTGACDTSVFIFFFQAEDGIRDLVRSRGLGDVYKRQRQSRRIAGDGQVTGHAIRLVHCNQFGETGRGQLRLSLIHI